MLAMFSCVQAFEYTLRSGDYDIRITAHFKHTIRSVTYQGCLLGKPNGFYGAIVIPKPAKYIGAGHSEGGLEQLLSYVVECDGVRVEPARNAVLEGKRLSVEKVSLYDNVLLRCRLELTPEGLVETKRFVTVAPQTFNRFDPHIFCFTEKTTDYCALTADGRFIAAKFSGKNNTWHIQDDVKYVAEYDAAAKKGVLLYYPQVIPGMGRKAAIWEVLKGYNKYYMFAKIAPSVPAGWQSPVYTVCLRGFQAESAAVLPEAVKEEADAAASRIVVPEIALPEL